MFFNNLLLSFSFLGFLIICAIFSNCLKIKTNSKAFICVSFFYILFFFSFRSYLSGSQDNQTNYDIFTYLRSQNDFSEILNYLNVKGKYFLGFSFAYYFIMWCVAKVFYYYFFFQLLCGAFFVGSLLIFIFKNSKNVHISIMICASIGLFGFAMNAIRQSIAIAIILLSYNCLQNKKRVLSVLLALLASLFHISALIFVVVLLLRIIKKANLRTLYNILVPTVVLVISPLLIFCFYNLTGHNYFNDYLYGFGGFSTAFFLAVCFYLLFKNSIKLESEKWLFVLLTSVLFIMRFFVSAQFDRVSFYFIPFCALFLADHYDSFDSHVSKKDLYWLFVISLYIIFLHKITTSSFSNYRLGIN